MTPAGETEGGNGGEGRGGEKKSEIDEKNKGPAAPRKTNLNHHKLRRLPLLVRLLVHLVPTAALLVRVDRFRERLETGAELWVGLSWFFVFWVLEVWVF